MKLLGKKLEEKLFFFQKTPKKPYEKYFIFLLFVSRYGESLSKALSV